MSTQTVNSVLHLAQELLGTLLSNPSELPADQLFKLHEFFRDGYTFLDDHINRHIDGDTEPPF